MAKKCLEGCICKRHNHSTWTYGYVCPVDCKCGRHNGQANGGHLDGCSCSFCKKLGGYGNKGKKHPKDCECGVHKGSWLGKTMSTEQRDKLSAAHLGKPAPWNIGRIVSADTKQKMSESAKRDQQRPERKEQMRQIMVDLWQTPEFVSKQMKSRGVTPNKLEKKFEEILEPFGFDFVGDGKLIVKGKCPDFWNGENKLIEIYGDYWHQGQDPQDRIDLFKTVGYDCLVIWEHELEDEPTVLERIRNFNKRY